MIDFMYKGGPLMWLILLCSIISLMVFAERMIYFHRSTIHIGEFLQGLWVLVRKRNYAEALHECAGTSGPVARVIHTALVHHDAPRAELKEIVQEAGQLEVPKLEQKLAILSTLAYATPLIGLLGTVSGMINIFVEISTNAGYASATDLSSGIYQSLLTTAAGLVVAVPSYVAYGYLSAWVNTFLHDMERGGIEIVNMIVSQRTESGIIEFDSSRRRTSQQP